MRRTARPWPIAITVEGLNIERFVRRAGEAEIRLTGMRRRSPRKLTACVPEYQLAALQELAVQGGWKLTLGQRQGWGHAADWLHRRWLLTAAILLAGVALAAASQIMWRIEIADAGSYDADLRQALKEMGISVPMLRRNVQVGELRDALEWRYPRIAWFECGWRGSILVIRPVEGVLPRKDGEYDGSCDVVATRDGIIHSIVTRAGTSVVEAGDFVRKGEVLIRGEERTSGEGVRPVAARGSVTARVWEGASIRMSAVETITSYTGSTDTVWTIRTPWFDLWPMADSGYDQYDTAVSELPFGGIFIPMKLRIERRMEANCTAQIRNADELEADAYQAALRKLYEKVGNQESLIDIWGNCSMIDAENIVSVAIGEMLVEIGTQVPASGMAAPEA